MGGRVGVCYLLCLVIFGVILKNGCLCVVLGGGAGGCLSFYKSSNYVITKNVRFGERNVTDDFSVELWMRSTSPNMDHFTPFSYSTLIDDQRIAMVSYKSYFFHGMTIEFPPPKSPEEWHHYAFTWTRSHGNNTRIYVDGSLVLEDSIGDSNSLPLEEGGSLVYGQEQDSVGGGFDVEWTFKGQIDEFRLWSVERKADEILNSINRTLFSNESSQTIIYYKFDDGFDLNGNLTLFPKDSPILSIQDSSMNGHRGFFSEWKKCNSEDGCTQCYLSTANQEDVDQISLEELPRRGASTAPIWGDESTPTVAYLDRDSHFHFSFRAWSSIRSVDEVFQTEIWQYPTRGTIEHHGASVTYHPNETHWIPGSIDRICYTIHWGVRNETLEHANGTVLFLYNTLPTIDDISLTIPEDSETTINLEPFDEDGDAVECKLTSLPSKGQLYINSEELNSVSNQSGYLFPSNSLIYSPPFNTFGTSFEFGIQCVDSHGSWNSSSNQTTSVIKISLTGVDEVPRAGSALFAVELGGGTVEIKPSNESAQISIIEAWVNLGMKIGSLTFQTVFQLVQKTTEGCMPVLYLNYSAVESSLILSIKGAEGILRVNNVRAGFWTHFAVAFNESVLLSTNIEFFVNGSLTSTHHLAQPPFQWDDLCSITLGSMEGIIDDFRIWKLPPENPLNMLYRVHDVVGSIGLLLAMDFNEGVGETLFDRSNSGASSGIITRPAKRVESSRPGFEEVFSREDMNVTITLPFVDVDTHVENTVAVITELPEKGTLFQVMDDGSLGDPISQKYLSWLQLMEPITQWVMNVTGYSSWWGAGSAYSPWNVEGPPSRFLGILEGGIYGDCAECWCPLTQGNPEGEWLELAFEQSVYVQRVEIYQNYYPGSVVGVSLMNAESNNWTEVWGGEVQQSEEGVYVVHMPDLCERVFPAKRVRIDMDTSGVFGWNEIDAIALIGTEIPPPGVVVNSDRKVLYTPISDGYGDRFDSFTYAISDCAYSPIRQSLSASYSINIAGVNDAPESWIVLGEKNLKGSVVLTCQERIKLRKWLDLHSIFGGSEDLIADCSFMIGTSDLDGDSLTLQIVPLGAPIGQLNFSQNSISAYHSDLQVTGEDAALELSFFPNFDECGLNYAAFVFYTRDSSLESDLNEVTVDILCAKGHHLLPLWVLIVCLVVTILLLVSLYGIILGVFFFRHHNEIKSSLIVFLMLILAGAVLMITSNLFLLLKVETVTCAFNFALLSLGFMMMYSALFAKIYRTWRIFLLYFNNKSKMPKKKVPIDLSQGVLFSVVSFMMLIDLFIVIWMLLKIEPLEETYEGDVSLTEIRCNGSSLAIGFQMGYIVLVLLLGIFLSVSTRQIDRYYYEARVISIAITIQSLSFVGAFPVVLLIPYQGGAAMVQICGVSIAVVGSIIPLFYPKFKIIYSQQGGAHWQGDSEQQMQTRGHSVTKRAQHSSSSEGDD